MGRQVDKQRKKDILKSDTMRNLRAQSGEQLDTDSRVKRSGDTLDGHLSQGLTPTDASHLTRKGYVDTTATNAAALRIEDADNKVHNTHINDDAKGGANGSFGLRKILKGDGPGAAGETHTHSSVNFNIDYTDEERRRTLTTRRLTRELLASLPERFAPLTPALELLLDVAHQLIDHPEQSGDDFQEAFENNSFFRHEYLMSNDASYSAAFRIEHDEELAELEPDAREHRLAARGRKKYGDGIGHG